MKRTTTLALAIAALVPMGAAVAGDGTKDKSGHMGPSFDTLDVNRDGRVSQAEAGVDASIVFSSADRDGDGYLDKKEWKNKDKSSSGSPQQQSMPEPSSDATAPSDATVPPAATEPTPDTETPRQ
jgi:hypothetical protein